MPLKILDEWQMVFVSVEVLWPSQLIRVCQAWSVYNHTFPGQALLLTSICAHSRNCQLLFLNQGKGGKWCRPWSVPASCGIWFASTLFAWACLSEHDTFNNFLFFHYENMPIQIYTKISPPKNRKFSDKKLCFSYFCSKTEVVLTSTHNLCFWAEIRKIMYTPVNPTFTI